MKHRRGSDRRGAGRQRRGVAGSDTTGCLARDDAPLSEEQATAGVFTSRHLPDKMILALCAGSRVADLAVGVDLTVAYLGKEGMTHLFRVFETIAPRVKQASGLCIVKAGQ